MYIDFRFSRAIPTIRSSSSPGSRSTFHERFGEYFVIWPLFISENVVLVNSAPPSTGGGTLRASCGSARDSDSREPSAMTGSSGRNWLAGQPEIST